MKKTLAIIMAVALLCIMAVGTTLSYFTDTEADKNVMTVGKVDIIQTETDRAGNPLASNSLKLFPVTSDPDASGLVPVANNGVDKFVNVKLAEGSEDAYVRTVFAFEMRKINGKWQSPITNTLPNQGILHLVTEGNRSIDFPKDLIIYVDASGKYSLNAEGAKAAYIIGFWYYGNDGLIEKGNTDPFTSLKQVYLGSRVGNGFYEQVGNSYEILVVSQAVQAQGFANAEAAFAAAFPNDGMVDWFANVPTT